MEASNNPPPRLTRRHYSGLIATFELFRGLGLILAVIWAFALGQLSGGFAIIIFISSALAIYVSTTTFIAVIDLLSKIELNTRKRRSTDL